MRYVVVPQAVRRVIPPLLNDFIGLQKDTALVDVIGVLDVVHAGADLRRATYVQPVTRLPWRRSLFLLVTIPLTRFVDYLIKRDAGQRRRQAVR